MHAIYYYISTVSQTNEKLWSILSLKRNPIFRLFKQWLLAVMHMISHDFRLFLIQTIIQGKDSYGYLFRNFGIKRKRLGFNFQTKAFCWMQLNNNNYNKDTGHNDLFMTFLL